MHNAFGLLEYLGALGGLLLLWAALRGSAPWRALAATSAVAALFVALGFVGVLLPRLEAVRGVSQRVAEAAIFLWIAHASVALLRHRHAGESEKGAPA